MQSHVKIVCTSTLLWETPSRITVKQVETTPPKTNEVPVIAAKVLFHLYVTKRSLTINNLDKDSWVWPYLICSPNFDTITVTVGICPNVSYPQFATVLFPLWSKKRDKNGELLQPWDESLTIALIFDPKSGSLCPQRSEEKYALQEACSSTDQSPSLQNNLLS